MELYNSCANIISMDLLETQFAHLHYQTCFILVDNIVNTGYEYLFSDLKPNQLTNLNFKSDKEIKLGKNVTWPNQICIVAKYYTEYTHTV